MSADARGVLRNAGLLLGGFALLMLIFTQGAMLWMDVPLLIIAAGMVAYALWDARRSGEQA